MKPFSKMRSVPDKVLNEALTNHQHVLRQIANWIIRHDQRNRWVWIERILVWSALGMVVWKISTL